MKISLDNGKTWNEVEDVRIIHDIDDKPEDGESVEYEIHHTHEGTIENVWFNNQCLGTASVTCNERTSLLLEDIR